MSDFATRLVHDAAEAIDAHAREECGRGRPYYVAIWEAQDWAPEARAAVVAVLEALASAYETDTSLMGAGSLRALAERVKEARNG